MGLTNSARSGFAASGDCSECDCEDVWCHYIDFTVSDGGFDPVSGFTSVYTSGQGWGQGVGQPGIVVIERAIASTNITQVAIKSTVVAPNGGVGIRSPLPFINSSPGQNDWTFNIGNTVTGISIAFDSNFGGASNPSWAGKIISVQIKGTGDNPFGSENCPEE